MNLSDIYAAEIAVAVVLQLTAANPSRLSIILLILSMQEILNCLLVETLVVS